MDLPDSSQPPPSSLLTGNPVVAVGRKVKSVLSTHQRPSVRILRGPASAVEPRQRPVSRGDGEKSTHDAPLRGGQAAHAPLKENASASQNSNARTRAGAAIRSLFGREESSTIDESSQHEYDPDTVDLLDVVDPEVSTLSTLTNVQNSLFVPSLGRLLNRRPAYRLSDRPGEARRIDKVKAALKHITSSVKEEDEEEQAQYAVLPRGETLDGWTRNEKQELDDLVRHMLHSRRARFNRSMKGFWQYVRRPLGLFITVYATLITLFGAAWVLFLIGWISLGSKRDYIINVVDNVLVGLFAVIGDGLAPFRAVDTYHMIYIAYFHRKTWKKREKLGLPELQDRNDLPDQRKEDVEPAETDLESLVARRIPRSLARRIAPRIPQRLARRIVTRSGIDNPSYEYTVLNEEEQAKLEHHERKFSKSHTFYKPHETETHHAFPLNLLVIVVVLLDCHSALQISLGACTWGIPYQTRPFALTTVILCCSITCNIMGGVMISVGDKRTRKKEVIERIMRQELTSEAIEQLKTRWMKEAEGRGELDKSVRKRLEEEKEDAENEEIKKAWKVVPSLPKTLLGKGEDHRQPSLPQKARGSSSSAASTGSLPSTTKKSKSKGSAALPPVQKSSAQPAQQKSQPSKGAEPPEEGRGQKIMRLIRRADMDQS